MNILITGASGFVGRSLLKHIEFANITAISRTKQVNSENVHWEQLSLRDLIKSELLLTNKYDTVIHLAAKAHVLKKAVSLAEYREVNRDQTISLAERLASNGMKRFVFISSIGVNGSHTPIGSPFTENTKEHPHSDYAISKFEAEEELKKLAENMNFELVIIRPPLVYGENAPGNFKNLLNLILKGLPLPFGLVNNSRSFVSVNNLCDFIALVAIHSKAANELFLISDDENISTKQLIKTIWQAKNIKSFLIPIPIFIFRFLFKAISRESMSIQLFDNLEVDNSKAKKLLGWVPKETMFDVFKQST
jgi:nucleoside-diphosphate-sugar epimerase